MLLRAHDGKCWDKSSNNTINEGIVPRQQISLTTIESTNRRAAVAMMYFVMSTRRQQWTCIIFKLICMLQ
jgi:hypothetical protein